MGRDIAAVIFSGTFPSGGVIASSIRFAGGRTKPTRSRDEERKSHAIKDFSTAQVHAESAGFLRTKKALRFGHITKKKKKKKKRRKLYGEETRIRRTCI